MTKVVDHLGRVKPVGFVETATFSAEFCPVGRVLYFTKYQYNSSGYMSPPGFSGLDPLNFIFPAWMTKISPMGTVISETP